MSSTYYVLDIRNKHTRSYLKIMRNTNCWPSRCWSLVGSKYWVPVILKFLCFWMSGGDYLVAHFEWEIWWHDWKDTKECLSIMGYAQLCHLGCSQRKSMQERRREAEVTKWRIFQLEKVAELWDKTAPEILMRISFKIMIADRVL